MAQNPNYSDEDIRQILNLAASRQESQGLSSDLLRRSAAELGISEEHLAAAEEEYRANRERTAARAQFEAKRRDAFYRSLVTYLLVNVFLAYLSLKGGDYWFLWVLGFWGMSVFQNAVSVFGPNRNAAFDRWQADQQKTPVPDITTVIDQYRRESGDKLLEEKLHAIKFVRENTSLSLEEAKKLVENHQIAAD